MNNQTDAADWGWYDDLDIVASGIVRTRSIETTEELIHSWPWETLSDLRSSMLKKDSQAALKSSLQKKSMFRKKLQELSRGDIVPFDVVFCVGDVTVKAHQCIVASRCKIIGESIGRTILHSRALHVDSETILTVDLNDTGLKSCPKLLSKIVENCYGGVCEDPSAWLKHSTVIRSGLGEEFQVSCSSEVLQNDLKCLFDSFNSMLIDPVLEIAGNFINLNLNRLFTKPSLLSMKPDVEVVGKFYSDSLVDSKTEDRNAWAWKFKTHSAVVCAHSDYARSLFTHGWRLEKSKNKDCCKLLILDASDFTEEVAKTLLAACYSNSLGRIEASSRNEKVDFLFQLYIGATYLGMESVLPLIVSEMVREVRLSNVMSIMSLAVDFGADEVLASCLAFVSPHFFLSDHLENLDFHVMETILESECFEANEDKILEIVLKWSKNMTLTIQKQLISHVRLAYVPFDSAFMQQAIRKKIITRQDVATYERFQIDPHFRDFARKTSTAFTIRHNATNRRLVTDAYFQKGPGFEFTTSPFIWDDLQ